MLNMDGNTTIGQILASKDLPIAKDILSIMEILNCNQYITFEDLDELDAYAYYIMYRVQQDFYDLGKECDQFGDMLWDDFVLFMRQCKPARTAAAIVVRETMKNFYQCGCYNFDAAEATLNVADEHGDMLHFSSLFSPEEGRAVVETLLFHAELAQYKRHPDYSWQEFLTELVQKGPLWQQVLTAFHDALTHLDFKPFWQSEKLAELLSRSEAEA